MHDYIPRQDGRFDEWQDNYTGYALDNSPALGLSHAEVEALETAQIAWRKRYSAVVAARAELSSAVAAKDAARADYVKLVRSISGRLRVSPQVSEAQRVALGLPIPDTIPTRTLPPDTFPVFTIDMTQRLVHRLRFTDSATPQKRAKPRGVLGAQLWVALTAPGQPTPTDLDAYTFSRIVTRTPTAVEYAGEEAGKTAHYLVRWINTKCEPGPWGPIASATVAG